MLLLEGEEEAHVGIKLRLGGDFAGAPATPRLGVDGGSFFPPLEDVLLCSAGDVTEAGASSGFVLIWASSIIRSKRRERDTDTPGFSGVVSRGPEGPWSSWAALLGSSEERRLAALWMASNETAWGGASLEGWSALAPWPLRLATMAPSLPVRLRFTCLGWGPEELADVSGCGSSEPVSGLTLVSLRASWAIQW